METTKKVTKVRENIKNYQGKNGPVYVHGITLEGDPQEWEYHSLTDKCTKFVPTQEATFTTDVKQNGNYTNYKISPVQAAKPAFNKGSGFKQEPKDQGLISWLSCFSSVCNLYAQSSEINNFQSLLNKANQAFEEALKHSSK
jgi:hypothetical protein